MNPQTALFGEIISIFALFGLFLFFLFWQFSAKVESAETETKSEKSVNYDIRTDKSETAKLAMARFAGQVGKSASAVETDRQKAIQAADDLRSKVANLKIENNETLRIPEVIATKAESNSGFLTSPTNEKRTAVLSNFLKQNRDLIGLDDAQIDGLKTTADYTNPAGNLSYVHFEQEIGGIPVFQGEIKAGFTRQNEIVRVINNLAPSLDENALSNNFSGAEQAVSNASKYIEDALIKEQTTAEKFYFPLDYGIARTAWRVFLSTKTESFYVVVDAQDGTLLWRKNLTESQTQSVTYEVYGNLTSMMRTADSPSPFSPGCLATPNCPQPPAVARQSFMLIGNEPPYTFNNNGWIADGETRTIGNNVEAGIDRDGTNGIDPNGWAFGNPNRNFVYAYNPGPGIPPPGEAPVPTTQTYPPSAFQQGSVAHVFYTVNRWHDETYLLGFTEQARNFQTNNFGRGGLENDSYIIEVQDSSGTNGANTTTTADGTRPRSQSFIWTGATPDRDGALDSQAVVHEITHGLSNRLHGNSVGLGSNMARGMGEGWSDFYAFALLSEPTDNPAGTHALGGYITHQITGNFTSNYYYGIRRFPTAIRSSLGLNGLPHNPITFRYLNSDCNTLIGTTTTNPNSAFPRNPVFGAPGTPCDQIHNAGEIWNAALWEMRHQFITKHGATEGNRRALQYVTDGMKLSPLNPTMLQSRDAILTSAQVSDATDLCPAWRGFAIRGMGFSASIQNIGTGSNNTAVTEAFEVPAQCRTKTRADFDGDGKSDVSVFRPSQGIWYLNRSTAGFAAANWGISTDKIVSGDYDGDQRTDLAVFRRSENSTWYIFNSATNTVRIETWGANNIEQAILFDTPTPADYDGDGRTDLAVWRTTDNLSEPARFLIKHSSTNSGIATQWGSVGDIPAPADYDGDNKTDLAIYRSGVWWILNSTDNTWSVTQWGLSGDKLVAADYDGDGRDDLAVFRPSDRTWYVRGSTSALIYLQFGLADDIPAPGDYDGNGKTDIAVYRNGTWYINFIGNVNNFVQITQFGLGGDIPIPSGYLP
jgi:hypothetical protein